VLLVGAVVRAAGHNGSRWARSLPEICKIILKGFGRGVLLFGIACGR
jgi:hypothetical protein